MPNQFNDVKKSLLKKSYEDFWVPVFGRALRLFSSFIEGEVPKEKQTYDLRDK